MKAKLKPLLVCAGVLATICTLLVAGNALAQDFVPVNEAARPRMDPNPFIIGAYGFVWVALVVYVVGLARGLGRAQGEIDELRKKLDASTRRTP